MYHVSIYEEYPTEFYLLAEEWQRTIKAMLNEWNIDAVFIETDCDDSASILSVCVDVETFNDALKIIQDCDFDSIYCDSSKESGNADLSFSDFVLNVEWGKNHEN